MVMKDGNGSYLCYNYTMQNIYNIYIICLLSDLCLLGKPSLLAGGSGHGATVGGLLV